MRAVSKCAGAAKILHQANRSTKTLHNLRKKCSSHLLIPQHFSANSAGTFKASQNCNKNFGITQPERLVMVKDSKPHTVKNADRSQIAHC
jgi:hypothetical protein